MRLPAGRRPRRWMRRLAGTIGLLFSLGVTAPSTAEGDRDTSAGRALFEGQLSIPARLSGHDVDLPPAASRCTNCHRRDTAPPGSAGDDTRSYGPRLDVRGLTESRARRGGPPSRYDAAALCRLLRDGVDPAWVLIDRAMPRFRASDAQCSSLWRFLTEGGGE